MSGQGSARHAGGADEPGGTGSERWPRRRRDALRVLLLGGFRLQVDDGSADLPTAPQRMVALLALRGAMSRSRLAGTLWPETPEQRALASLRTGIWRTNQAADQLVVCHGGMVDLGAHVDVDTRRFVAESLHLMEAAEVSLGATGLSVDDLVGENELLPDWEDEWLVAERERLRQLRLHVLEAVAARFCASGEYGLAVEAALAAVRIDPLRESAHRAVIRVHLAEGNVVEARRALASCRSTLRREVGVDVSPETLQLVGAEPPHARALAVPARR
ncbi:AfsR/SARP family transcriptional regulator [Cellulomonas sp. ICMP 17802]|uniref:AfsR/SARP family transcriptional regulator n=1 Tax=Cellulomonas sp. ICMP 17802 TaxID=3239199 RepID=UPI00351B21CE